jgi:hypothetical protein
LKQFNVEQAAWQAGQEFSDGELPPGTISSLLGVGWIAPIGGPGPDGPPIASSPISAALANDAQEQARKHREKTRRAMTE